MATVFYISLGIITYTYIGYPLLIFLVAQMVKPFRKRVVKRFDDSQDSPTVTIIIAAYNELNYLEAKIKNTLSLEYPNERKLIWVVTDGSTDGSEKLVADYPQVQLLHQPDRHGKAAAINRALPAVLPGIVIFTDANILLNRDGLHHLVNHFKDPWVGAVAGEKKVSDGNEKGAVAVEGLYWSYESIIRKSDASVHSVTGAVGELFALRTELVKPMPEEIICDDLYMSLQVIEQGYRIAYEEKAYGVEAYSFSISKEWKRKIRIAAGSIQMLKMTNWWALFIKRPIPVLQFINRKLLRWIVVPYLVVLMPLIVALIDMDGLETSLLLLFFLCFLFYGGALLGWLLIKTKFIPRFFYLPFYFVWANLAMIVGTWEFINKKSNAVWEKVR
jgi:cellulose synthase/poly-beta-1,6-N-acetylglucosamine synthase-like glycosyltransferase